MHVLQVAGGEKELHEEAFALAESGTGGEWGGATWEGEERSDDYETADE